MLCFVYTCRRLIDLPVIAGKGQTVNLHFTEMNLEGGNTFHNGINAQTGLPNTCADFDAGTSGSACDWVYVYDGTYRSACLLWIYMPAIDRSNDDCRYRRECPADRHLLR